DQVPETVKVDRLRRLNACAERWARHRNQRYGQQVVEVLVEGRNPKDSQQLMGRTRSNRLVFLPAAGHGLGDLVPVRIDAVRPFSLSGCSLSTPEAVSGSGPPFP
ncbi:MAG: TRAM domain-containing protein, partial [Synechococcus sp. SB0664_bin_36]|nr:TRAM domain-containing protein [Synechococcus sp. SB0664_bin_36]